MAMQRFDAYQIAFQYFGHLLLTAPNLDFLQRTEGLLTDLTDCAIFENAQIPESLFPYQDWTTAVSEIAASHLRLFSGPTPLAPPWESVWLERKKLLFGASTDKVSTWYAEWGLKIVNGVHEPPDHLGFELGFISHLISLRNQNDGRFALKAAGDFMDQHTLKYADKVVEAAKNDKYDYYPRHLELMMKALRNLQNDLQIGSSKARFCIH